MWNPISIDIHNLFAHKHSYYEFKNNACTVIFGENKDDKGLQNNGAGKTTLFEAVSIALTNESLRSVKKESFINRESDDCKIVFCLENKAMKMSLKIERQFFRGSKSAKVSIFENGEKNTQIVSVNEANKRIIELIGINRDDLLRYYIISQDNHYTFFTASDGEKKEIMNRITSADMVNPVISYLDEIMKQKDAEFDLIANEINKLSDKIQILCEQRKELLENDNSEKEILDIRGKISVYESKIEKTKRKIIDCNDIIKRLNKEISKINILDKTELDKKKRSIKKEVEDIESEIEENERALRKLKREIDLTITCPNCKEEFIPDGKLDLNPDEIRYIISNIESENTSLNKKLSIKQKILNDVKKSIQRIDDSIDKMNCLVSDRKVKENELKILKDDEELLADRIREAKERINNIKKAKKNNVLLKKIESQISECNERNVILLNKLKPIEKELDMIKFWKFNLGKNGFSTYLANKSIKIIEGITNSFLRKFGVDLSVLINGFKVLKSGDVREKIDIFVSNDGITAEQFMSKSGGERGRVTLAGILGIQHLINMSTNGKGLNLLLLDEVLPGIDALGQEKIIKVLETIGSTIMLITQNVSESFNNENTLYVVKSGGESRYV